MQKRKNILVLGVGNILLHDEGIGVHVVRDLEEQYSFSKELTLLDGGTLGIRLLDAMGRADYMIVADTLCSGKAPGTITRLTGSELRGRVAAKNSQHQVSFLETIAYADFLGMLPETVMIGCEPKDLSAWGTELTEEVAAARPQMIARVIDEIRAAGGEVMQAQM
ncbi:MULTISPECIES: HyaD/HybD family hydrogenase maturation endopeptidase [Desulfosediminicola]|uniref:HyaD/HybD family hydrogenase maturation endopeptidase n=1 Tax=Desulfosediminicola TaxID=2886823 RepID=UPI0010AC5B13|nr:HyaD/HybD family hydrogenase maturation endopeptidase [Desulfosediminicola ganghwensis]